MTFQLLPWEMLPLVLGPAAALLSTLAYMPYIYDTLRGETQPQRASWLIWSVLGSIAFASQVWEGAGVSLWFAGAQVSGTIIVFLLSISRGRGIYLSRPDERVLWMAVIGLVVWYFTETAVYALALTITISLLGGVLTVTKAYRAPESETLATWTFSLMGSLCAVAAIGTWEPVLLAYPLYLLVLNTAIVAAMGLGRAAQQRESRARLSRNTLIS